MLLVQFSPTMVKHSGGTMGGQRGAHAPPNHPGGASGLTWGVGTGKHDAMLSLISRPLFLQVVLASDYAVYAHGHVPCS